MVEVTATRSNNIDSKRIFGLLQRFLAGEDDVFYSFQENNYDVLLVYPNWKRE